MTGKNYPIYLLYTVSWLRVLKVKYKELYLEEVVLFPYQSQILSPSELILKKKRFIHF